MSAKEPEAISPEAVLRELERLLASPALKGSKRSQEFLHHIVDTTLRGGADTLKERTIGVALFHRTPDYDTSDDAIVRVKANEVRRRLVQAYQEAGPPTEVEIVLPTGAYVPEFRPVCAPVTSAPVALRTGRVPSSRWIGAMAALALLVIGISAGAFWWRGRSPSRIFWRPFLAAEGTVLISVPHPTVYVLSPKAREAATPTVDRAEIHQNSSDYIGVGDLMASSRLAAHFSNRGKPYQIRPGNDTSFAELRNAPAVFVGAFTNQWTMQMSEGFRYVFRKENGVNSIEDTGGDHRRWTMTRTNSLVDYAIITRLFESRTGRPVIIAAGLGHYGTQAAGELLTNEDALDALLRQLPSDWPNRNFQLVIQAEVLGKSPGPPHLVASHLW
ncbi:MAG: hypothetical protein HY821_25440 [Acidobacteria bacterium]|nr:hypothetical protein [Acidobacteriota bacterium]